MSKRIKTQRTDNATTSDLQSALRAAGLRSTSPRIAVLRYLHQSRGPNSHAELVEALTEEGFDRATLYRNLMDLAEADLVSRTDLGDHVWRFELKQKGANHATEHPHFICTDCGEIACLADGVLQVTPTAKAPRSFQKQKLMVQVKGLCDNCL